MRDIDHISVLVGPPVTRDYRIDRNGTVVCFWGLFLISDLFLSAKVREIPRSDQGTVFNVNIYIHKLVH